MFVTIISFLFFTGLVGFLTWRITRRDDHDSSSGYFLAGRSLTFPLIAGSLLLTNLSTEQLVGLNGDAFKYGLCVMVWEVVCVVALVFMAWLLILMLIIGELKPRETEFIQENVGAVDMTPWELAKPAGLVLIAIVISIYVYFADVSVLAS
jgi:uncharacterized sodium:solute symporter family permease YidK